MEKLEFHNRTRILILILSTTCLTLSYANSLAFNFTVICMDNSTDWISSPSYVNGLFSAVAFGSILGALPLMHCLQYMGMRYTLTIYGFISGIATFLFPIAVSYGYEYVFIVRALQGTFIGISFSSVGAIASQWSALIEAGTYISIISAHIQFSSILTMSTAGMLCESSYGWPVLYYVFGVLTILFHIIFLVFFRDHPKLHRNVSSKELSKITKDKPEFIKKQTVPYGAICTSKVIISVWLSSIGGFLGFTVFLYYGPTYMNKVIGLDVKSTGFATAFPYVVGAVVKFVSGPLSDNATCFSEKSRLLFFAVVSQGFMASCFIIIAFTESALIAQIAYTVCIGAAGMNIVGTIKCAQLVAQQHLHFVLGVISFAMCLLNLVLPAAVAIICPDNTADQWSLLFIGTAVFTIMMNIPFAFLADDKPAVWTGATWNANQVMDIEKIPRKLEEHQMN
ncbi:unnamed protein product [Auanema sp. JU1783]|nr:unnamed protein product [Auanema sp. JU1783]